MDMIASCARENVSNRDPFDQTAQQGRDDGHRRKGQQPSKAVGRQPASRKTGVDTGVDGGDGGREESAKLYARGVADVGDFLSERSARSLVLCMKLNPS